MDILEERKNAEALREQSQEVKRRLARLAERQGLGPVNQLGAQERGEDRVLKQFLKFAPSKFLGGPDPEIAENWLERITNIFAALGYTEERRNMIRKKWERAQTPWIWKNFMREFNEKFLPPMIQEKKDDEFIKLRQETSSVTDSEERFTKFSRFAPELVATERRRIRRFVQGLNVEIQEELVADQISTFTEALEKAQPVESAKTAI
ncbi:uncharacterized protein [Coffea arabica]|uniref:Retrotransposon gag domain-containing protein n=1 Tax=Coffea arabica TaxID=13443 RepID=A0ABM4VGX3_COFAR